MLERTSLVLCVNILETLPLDGTTPSPFFGSVAMAAQEMILTWEMFDSWKQCHFFERLIERKEFALNAWIS